jgi:hypothetical protein
VAIVYAEPSERRLLDVGGVPEACLPQGTPPKKSNACPWQSIHVGRSSWHTAST